MSIPRPLLAKGKVREIYDLDEHLLLVTSDRVSAFDVIFDQEIQDKGKVLNQISAFWFEKTQAIMDNHMISVSLKDYPEDLRAFSAELEGRSMLVKKAKMLPAEVIVRGYLEGSALKSYRKDQTVCGIKLPSGLRQGDKLPEPIFTPSTKAEAGHDINISKDALADLLGRDLALEVEEKALALFAAGSKHLEGCGLILADCKFEFGHINGRLHVCDELFTPDSSRFWEASTWSPGRAQQSFDKQFLREFLEGCDWDKTPPGPTLPKEIIDKTRARYVEAYERVTGKAFA